MGADRKRGCVAPSSVQVVVPLEIRSIFNRGQQADVDMVCVLSSGGYAVGGSYVKTMTAL